MSAAPIHSDEFEAWVVGAIVQQPDLIDTLADIVRPGDFYRGANAEIYRTVLALANAQQPINPIAVGQELLGSTVVMRGTNNNPAVYLAECIARVWSVKVEDVAATALKVRELSHERDIRAATIKLSQATEIGDKVGIDAAWIELERLRAETVEAAAGEDRFPSLDWAEAYKMDFSQIDWLPGRFMERGQQVTLVGSGKVGKSLFALEWVYACVTGRAFLGHRTGEPLTVLYLDRENSLRDIVTRAQAIGATPAELRRLVYKQFPNFTGTLDSSHQAARELLAMVDDTQPDVVVIDTVSRFISGEENSSNTWLQLYQLIHAPLKARGVACLRLDHFGKDEEKGSRGSSAKSQDVDHVWEMSVLSDTKNDLGDTEEIVTSLRMHRAYTRTGLGADGHAITRRGVREKGGMWEPGRTGHALTDGGMLAAEEAQMDLWVDLAMRCGAPNPIRNRDELKEWINNSGMKDQFPKRNGLVQDMVKALRSRQKASVSAF